MSGTSWTYIDNSYENEMMSFYIFILFEDEFICSKSLLAKSKVKIASHKCQEHQGQWFPTFLMSWTLLRIFLKVVDPLNKKGNKIHSFLPKTR